MDADAYRQESRERWNAAAAGWLAGADRLGRETMPVSAWLVDALEPQPGQRLLDLAAGTGEVGLLLAELVAPGGEVILGDFAPAMLTAAQERAAARGIANVRFRQIDAESIDLPAASLDGVACRWGYMLMADPAAALRETRRVLRPGRNVALATWASARENPWQSLVGQGLVEVGLAEPMPPGPGMFAWADPDPIAEHLEAAGFTDHHVEPLEFTMRYSGVEDWVSAVRQCSMRAHEALNAATEEQRAALTDALADAAGPAVGPDGALALPARAWVAWAAA